jgi:di/tricarboxylate transporter
MIFIGLRLLPDYGKITDLDKEFKLTKYLTNIVLSKESLKKASKLGDLSFLKEENVEVIQLRRGKNRYYLPRKDFELMENDVLKLKCDVDKIKQLKTKIGIEVRPLLSVEVEEHGQEEIKYVEAIIAPGSTLVGQKLKNIDFRGRYNAALLGIREREGLFSKLIRQEKVVSGDTLLLAVSKKELNSFSDNNEDFILISQPEFSQQESKKGILAIGIVIMVILLASLNVLPILVSAILGCLLLLVTRCIDAEQAYKSIDWKVIFLLAGAMSFGVALEKTGLAALTGEGVISISGSYGPVIMLSIIYLLTSLLTEMISNNATVVLLAPIVIAMAVSLGISPKPFLIAITFAASSSFMTPIGYQTNTMVYAAGNYKFKDFFKVGIWLNILFWILATLFIPYFFPF